MTPKRVLSPSETQKSRSFVPCPFIRMHLKLFLVLLLSISISNQTQSLFIDQIQAEASQLDALLGRVLAARQETIWSAQTRLSPDNQNANEQTLALLDFLTGWAQDRHARLACPNQNYPENLPWKLPGKIPGKYKHEAICHYVTSILEHFPEQSTGSASNSFKKLDLGKQKLAHLYQNLPGIVHQGKLYSGEESINGLIGKLVKEGKPQEAARIWRQQSQQVGDLSSQFVRIMNQLSNDGSGFDLWNLWNADLDIHPLTHSLPLAHSLWAQVTPFYRLLLSYLSSQINNGTTPIPAHLLGSFTGTQFDQLFEAIQPFPGKGPEIPKTLPKLLQAAQKVYLDLGFPPLPRSFWSRSRITQNTQSCHPLTFNFFTNGDVRTQICIQTPIDPGTWRRLLHELGHAYYFLAYSKYPVLYQMHPNSAVHEAIGESVALLASGCTRNQVSGPELINRLLKEALTSFTRIPYALSLETWRFEAMTAPRPDQTAESLNSRYWELREEIGGVSRPNPGPEKGEPLDALAKYHVATFMPYLRYLFGTFASHQIHGALCGGRHSQTPLAQCCSSSEAMDRFRQFLAQGVREPLSANWATLSQGQPWPGYQAEPLLEYYAPLIEWLQSWANSKEP